MFGGMLLGGAAVGALGDVQGRQRMLVYGLCTNAVAGLLSAWCAPTRAFLTVLRFGCGLGIGATVPPLFTLASELAPPETRGFWVTFIASFWMVGSIYVGVVAWWALEYTNWRILATLAALPSALGCLLVHWYVPESPRFAAMHASTPLQAQQALHIVHRLARAQIDHPYRHRSTQFRPWTLEELYAQYPLRDNDSETALTNQIQSQSHSMWEEFFQATRKLYHPSMLRTTVPLQLVWWALSFGTYGLYTWINTLFEQVELQNVYFNTLLFALANLPGNILALYLMDWVGRSRLLVSSIVGAALSLFGFAYVASSLSSGSISKIWIVCFACLFQCCTVISWDAINVLTSERFPTSVRSTGTGFCTASGRIGAMMAQFVNGWLLFSSNSDGSPVRLLLVAGMTLMLGALTPAFLPSHDYTGEAIIDDVSTTELPVYTNIQQEIV